MPPALEDYLEPAHDQVAPQTSEHDCLDHQPDPQKPPIQDLAHATDPKYRELLPNPEALDHEEGHSRPCHLLKEIPVETRGGPCSQNGITATSSIHIRTFMSYTNCICSKYIHIISFDPLAWNVLIWLFVELEERTETKWLWAVSEEYNGRESQVQSFNSPKPHPQDSSRRINQATGRTCRGPGTHGTCD